MVAADGVWAGGPVSRFPWRQVVVVLPIFGGGCPGSLLDPVPNGPLRGANFFVVLVDRIRDDDPQGNPRSHGADRTVNSVAPAKHPQTGQTVSVISGIPAWESIEGWSDIIIKQLGGRC
jgi:hypothetical protein